MTNWKGKTKGGLLGYKIFVFILRYLGLWAAYSLLFFVAFYFLLFSTASTKASYSFFTDRLGWSRWRAILGVYKTYIQLGQALIDRTAILSGLDKFTFEYEGEQHIQQIAEEGKGGVLISGHVGNWAIAGSILDGKLPTKVKVNIVMLAAEHQKIQAFLDKIQVQQQATIIPIGNDFSHIIAMGIALRKGELIALHGDRFLAGANTVTVDFLGAKAALPRGPFELVLRMKVPYVITYAFKDRASHYHFYSTPALVAESVEQSAQYFADNMALKIKKYPYQWFNFYDFWASPTIENKDKKQIKNG